MKRLFMAAMLAAFVSLSAIGLAAEPAASIETPPAKPKLPYTASKETTYLTAPLRADGSVDYIEALNEELSRGVTIENNAAVLLWKALGPKAINEKYRDRYFQKLGIPPLPETGEYIVDRRDYVKQNKIELPTAEPDKSVDDQLFEQEHAAMTRPWSKQEFPIIAAWLAANEKPLATAFEATKRPRRYDPLLGDDDTMVIAVLLPGINEHRQVARLLAARAMLQAKAGNVDAAWGDLLACHRLARLSAQGATLVDALVGIAIDGIACAGDRALMQHVPLTAKQAERMRADLAKLPTLRGMADKLDRGERYMFLDCTAVVARKGLSQIGNIVNLADGGGSRSTLSSLLDALGAAAMDCDSVLRNGNRWYDRLVAAARQPTVAERKAALKQFDQELRQLSVNARNTATFALELLGDPQGAVSRRVGDILIALLMPALTAVMTAEDRGVMQGELVQVGFALAAHRAEQGRYPEALADLAPRYVPKAPVDLFGDGALRYQAKDGGYLLYSVGPNGVDDDARGRDEAEEGQPWDDLVIRVTAKKNG